MFPSSLEPMITLFSASTAIGMTRVVLWPSMSKDVTVTLERPAIWPSGGIHVYSVAWREITTVSLRRSLSSFMPLASSVSTLMANPLPMGFSFVGSSICKLGGVLSTLISAVLSCARLPDLSLQLMTQL